MHFTYADPTDANEIAQGDVLQRTPAIDDLLKRYYNYFGSNEENQFFLVITQTCDLVPRSGGVCKAKYIELAAVRPIRAALTRELEQHLAEGFDVSFPIAGEKSRSKMQFFVQRLLNNNDPDYFFLHSQPDKAFPEDCCAFLHLSVPVKADNYAALRDARILSLEPVFQAKLGWLVGQIYSRVGTMDWSTEDLRRKIDQIFPKAALWIDDKHLQQAQQLVRDWQQANPGKVITKGEVSELLKKLPTKKQGALKQLRALLDQSPLIARAKENGVATDGDVEKLVSQIGSDQAMSAYLK